MTTSWHEVDIAQAAAEAMQSTIRHADTKAAALLGVTGGTVGVVVDHAFTRPATQLGILTAVLIAAFVVAAAMAVWHSLKAMRPRLYGPGAGNRFGLAWSCEPDNLPSSADRQRNEAWEHVSALARIARKKHGDIRQGVPWLVVAVVTACLEIVISVAVNL